VAWRPDKRQWLVIWPVALLATVIIFSAASDNDFHGALALLFLGALLVWQLDRPR